LFGEQRWHNVALFAMEHEDDNCMEYRVDPKDFSQFNGAALMRTVYQQQAIPKSYFNPVLPKVSTNCVHAVDAALSAGELPAINLNDIWPSDLGLALDILSKANAPEHNWSVVVQQFGQ